MVYHLTIDHPTKLNPTLAFQNQRTPEPEERIVKEYVVVPAARTAPVTVAPQKPKPIAVVPPTSLPELKKVLPDLESVARFAEEDVLSLPPPVLDPVVEALLKEARKARVGGDLLLSLTKLQEAELREPRDPNVLYGLGATYEAFGIFDKARDYYYGVFKLGPDAGSLFEKASFKVAQGLRQHPLGNIRQSPPQSIEPHRPALQLNQDQHGPFRPDMVHHRPHWTVLRAKAHGFPFVSLGLACIAHGGYLSVPWVQNHASFSEQKEVSI